jgi:hypothetical protein
MSAPTLTPFPGGPTVDTRHLGSLLEQDLRAQLSILEKELGELQRLLRAAQVLNNADAQAQVAPRVDFLLARREELQKLSAELSHGGEAPGAGSEPVAAAPPARPPIARAAPTAPPVTAGRATSAPARPFIPGARGEGAPGTNGAAAATDFKSKAPAQPAWEPRPLPVLEEERQSILETVEAIRSTDELSLTRFKTEVCRYRGAREERSRHLGAQDGWRHLQYFLKDKQRELWPNHYIIPMNPDSRGPTPEQWRELSALYAQLGRAFQVLEWVEKTAADQPRGWVDKVARPVVEAIGACSSRTRRWLHQRLPGQHDTQIDRLYDRLMDLGIFIVSLGPPERVPDEELEILSNELLQRLEDVKAATIQKERQERALADLHALLEESGFGSGESDDDRLCDAVARCLEERIPPSDKKLRDRLLSWQWMLEDDPRVTLLLREIEKENERLRALREAEAASDGDSDSEGDLSDDLSRMLVEILPRTEGKRGLMVGGVCRDENRRRIEQALRLKELAWPSTDPDDDFSHVLKDMEHAEIVFLTRFNRKRSKDAIPFCRDKNIMLVRLPAGYGLNQVVAQTHEQMFRRAAAEPVAA